MTISKKLAMTQVILFIVSTIMSIIAFATSEDLSSINFKHMLTGSIWAIISLCISIAALVIGICQIVYKVKEKTSGVYMAAGICALLVVIPIVNFFALIAGLILNIIGWAKK